MSAKLIIYLTGSLTVNGHRQREFQWSAAHGCYLYEGVEIDAAEFNTKYEKAVRTNSDLRPRVKVVSADAGGSARPAPPAAITTISAREVTADEAEEVLARLRPDRLKKKTGPKPQVMEVA